MRYPEALAPLYEDQAMASARVLAEAIKDVAGELRLTDVADFVTFIHAEKFANIQDIVESSVELFFKHGTLTYGTGAEFELSWDGLPSITIDLEFRHMAVAVLFTLELRAFGAGVEIKALTFHESPRDSGEAMGLLQAALTDARHPLERREGR